MRVWARPAPASSGAHLNQDESDRLVGGTIIGVALGIPQLPVREPPATLT